MKLKNLAILLFFTAILLGSVVFAQSADNNQKNKNQSTTSSNPANNSLIQRIGFNFVGVGVAVNQSDSSDFEAIRLQVQHVGKLLAANAIDSNKNISGNGRLEFGQTTYKLAEVKIEGDLNADTTNLTLTAKLQTKDGNEVGNIIVQKVKDLQNARLVGMVKGYWKGTITINGKTYDAYLPTAFSKRTIIPQRLETAKERLEKLKEQEKKRLEDLREKEKKRLEELKEKLKNKDKNKTGD